MSFKAVTQAHGSQGKLIKVPRLNQGTNRTSFLAHSLQVQKRGELLPKKCTGNTRKDNKLNQRPVHPVIYQCKQNLSPQIFDQKKFQMSIRTLMSCRKVSSQHKEPTSYISSLQMNLTNGLSQPPRLHQAHSNMDDVCSKMTESIILSSDTLDSQTQMSAPLGVDQFEKIKFLGQGKFGQVHLVKHKQTGFVCALKIIDKNVVREEKVQSQIAKELRIHSQLKCLNIITFYGFFDDQRYFYILLEYATEGSVFSKLKGRIRLQESQIQPIAKGLYDGLRFIHRMGFIHRDIKPQNIVLQFGIPKICDFGWATDCDDSHLRNSYCGTPLYLSPEMIRKQLYGTSVDIWASGLVIYQLLVGRVPFSIYSQNDMQQIIYKSIEFPQYVDRSQECESFIMKCLQKNPINRIRVDEALRHLFLNNVVKYQLEYDFFQFASYVLASI